MKNQTSKLIRYIALTFVGSLLIVTVSCQKEEKFSCDPVVNDWVKQYTK